MARAGYKFQSIGVGYQRYLSGSVWLAGDQKWVFNLVQRQLKNLCGKPLLWAEGTCWNAYLPHPAGAKAFQQFASQLTLKFHYGPLPDSLLKTTAVLKCLLPNKDMITGKPQL